MTELPMEERHLRSNQLCEMLSIQFPLIVAPMFLVSNEKMILAAIQSGVTGAIPALNYRSLGDLREGIRKIKAKTNGSFGINLIVNKSNPKWEAQLRICCEEQIAFIITSLGSPAKAINEARRAGILVFCDVTDIHYAKKVEELGADALIAVNNLAGGHAGSKSYEELIPALMYACSLPVISAGGVGTGEQIRSMMNLGAAGVSMGSVFIASEEASVSAEYKNACIHYGAKDIVMTTKLSGTPCTVINTPYVQKVGTEQNRVERLLNRNKRLKKWVKSLVFLRGMKSLQNAAFNSTYKTVWCAGPSIEHVNAIQPLEEIVASLKKNFFDADT
jgi:nitronate monooxygenase